MTKRYLLLFGALVLCLGACVGPTSGESKDSNKSNYSSNPSTQQSTQQSNNDSTSQEQSVESNVSMTSNSGSQVDEDDSLPLDTLVSSGLEQVALNQVLNSFRKESNNYYGGTFSKKLEMPSTSITTHQQLVDVFDYCGFYRVKELDLTINISGEAKIEACNLAYWDSSMLPGTVGCVFTENTNGTVKAKFKFVNDANSYVPKTITEYYPATFPYIYDYNNQGKAKISSIPYTGNKELDVHNSDQLIYAITHGYKPVMNSNSPAKVIYDRSVEILKDIIYQDMKDNEKLLAIDFYLSNNSDYDSISDNNAAFVSSMHANNTEELASLFRGFYAEGVLLNKGGVCYGFAKAQALLAGLLGFQVKLTHGKVGGRKSYTTTDSVDLNYETGNIYDAHGISLVRKDSNSRWGICDPTFRCAGSLPAWNDYVSFKRYPAVMLNKEFWQQTYTDADEVAFRYIQSAELVQESYYFVDDYRLVGGYRLDPKTKTDAINTMNGILETIKRVKSMNNSVSTDYYLFCLYPHCETDDDANNYLLMYDESIGNSNLNSVGYYYYRWARASLFNNYGYVIYTMY